MTNQIELIPLGWAVLDVLSRDIGHSAPALDVRPEWVSREVAALYRQWQKLPRAEDREEWVLTHYQTNPLIIEAMEAAKSGILSPRDALNQLHETWFRNQEQQLWQQMANGTPDQKVRVLNQLSNLYGVVQGRAQTVSMSNPPEPNQPMLMMEGVGFLYRSEITAVKAKAKNGKTHLAQIWAAALLSDQPVMGIGRDPEFGGKPARVLFIDTEQSFYSSYKLSRNILTMAGRYDPENPVDYEPFRTDNLRLMHTSERMPYLKGLVATGKYDVVILDGIKDLARDINDNIEADQIINDLTTLCALYQFAMLAVLHENPSKDSDKMRGHLGTELLNKAHDVFEISRDTETDVFNVKHTDSREHRIPNWAFHFNEDDEMETCEPTNVTAEGQILGQKIAEGEQIKWRQVLKAYSPDFGLAYTKEELIKFFAQKCKVKEGTAKNRIKYFYSKGWLKTMHAEAGERGCRYYISPAKIAEMYTDLGKEYVTLTTFGTPTQPPPIIQDAESIIDPQNNEQNETDAPF